MSFPSIIETYIRKFLADTQGYSIPMNLPGVVTLVHDATGVWTLYDPSGVAIDTTGSTTEGLQEAITYACTNGYNLLVWGGSGAAGATITCTTPIVFPAMQNKIILIHGCTLDFPSSISANTCVRFDSLMMMVVDFSGTQIVNAGTGRALVFKPENVLPVDGHITITVSKVHIQTIVNIHSPSSDVAAVPLIDFQTSVAGINDTEFDFDEVNASGIGIQVSDPAVGQSFTGVKLKAVYVHSQTGTNPCVKIGETSASNTRIAKNDFDLFVAVGVAAKRGIENWGSQNNFEVVVDPSVGSTGYAFYFNSGGNYNSVYSDQLSGLAGPTTYLSVGGTAALNKVINNRIRNQVVITVTASPFTYVNNDFVEEDVTINGTVTTVELTPDSVAFAGAGAGVISTLYKLSPGMGLKVTYAGAAPQMLKIL